MSDIRALAKLCCKITRMDEDNTIFVLLLGFLVAALSPFLIIWYLLRTITHFISNVIIPLIAIALLVFIGLPLICLFRWIYGAYLLFYSLFVHFFDTALNLIYYPEDDMVQQQP